MPTRREEIARILEEAEHPITAEELCQILDVRSRSVIYEDITHIAKSIKARGKELLVRPAVCGKCQYEFYARKTAKAPSRCPKCKSQWIIAPAFIIRDK